MKRRSLIRNSFGADVTVYRDQLLLDSAVLEDFFHRDRVHLDPYLFGDTQSPSEAVSALAEWTKDLTPKRLLYIASNEFSGDEYSSVESMLASKFTDFASASNVPVMSYFCELRREEKLRGENSPEVQGILSLTYSLLRQMIGLVPMEFEISGALSRERFEELDGTLGTWTALKSLFLDVQNVLLGKVYCVIDGMQWLGDSSTSVCMAELVGMLRHKHLKVLFTSSGLSRCLLGSLKRDELVLLEGRSADSSSLWQVEEGMRELG
jgi:hypothetical protein